MFFRERQLQLEELTKELKRVTEETGVLKSKLQSMKSSNQVHMTFLYHQHVFSQVNSCKFPTLKKYLFGYVKKNGPTLSIPRSILHE